MSESADFDPGPWRAHDFAQARTQYDHHVERSYAEAVTVKRRTNDLIPDHLTTNSHAPVSIICDVSSSLGEQVAVIFSKLAYLELEAKVHLGDGLEISFAAVGDAFCDRYPLQVRPFTSGLKLRDQLERLVIEQGGGPPHSESYELAALYYARKVIMPQAINPILIFIADEKPYDQVDKHKAADLLGIRLNDNLSTQAVFAELKRLFSVYVILIPYGRLSGVVNARNDDIHLSWSQLVGEDHIAVLNDPERVVDVQFGIFAQEVGKVDYFRDELEGRQTPEQVETVYEALTTIHGEVPEVGKRATTNRLDSLKDIRDSTPLL